MDHVVVSCPLPRKCIMADEVRDKVRVLDPLLCPMVPVEMPDKLRQSATDPISKYTFPPTLHLSMHLWLHDGLVARDYDRSSFLSKYVMQHDKKELFNASNASRIRSNVLSLGRSNFPNLQKSRHPQIRISGMKDIE